MDATEPKLRLGWLQLPWYRHMLAEVPYRRSHLLCYLSCLAGFATTLGLGIVGVAGMVFGLQDPSVLGCALAVFALPLWGRLFAYGRAHWYFAEIEAESAHPDGLGRMGFHAAPEVREAERLLARIADASLEPGERQALRMALKALLNQLAANAPRDVWEPLHARAPYLTVLVPD
ncbi:MAG: hypothetical protein Q7P63_16295 [Verrucomicrobiota bacterium JB022]|nr:hypothetical protein [Verrucomicrobiota bacterium JB022]